MPVSVSNLVKSFGGAPAVDNVSFTVDDGAFCALLGPSGSGKTTVLRMLAGLETPDAGSIEVHGRVVFGERRVVPAEDRDVGMVFQDYALWPHMTVAQNIEFGLKLRRLSRADVARQTAEALERVRLTGLDRRYPDQLSGGQQQRVAIARALASRPRLLLLDEPLSNLDAALREEMRVELVQLLKDQGITAIYVTHDRVEALAMADVIVVMRDGRIAQIGPPEILYARPANTFIAGFLGAATFVPGDGVAATGGEQVVRRGDLVLRGAAGEGLALGERAVAMLRPEDGALYTAPPSAAEAEECNILRGEMVYSEFLGGRWRHVVAVSGDVMVHVLTPSRPPAQRQVWLAFPVEHCVLLPAES